MSDNLIKEYLEEIELIPSDKYFDYATIAGERWVIYKMSDNTLIYVRYELTGKLGYAFFAKTTPKGYGWARKK